MKIVMPEQAMPEKKLLSVVYGWPGTGKTTLSYTLNKPFLIDFDRGAARALGLQRCPVIMPDNYDEVRSMISSGEMKAFVKEHGFQTVIIDTGGTLLDNFITPWLIDQNEKLGNANGGLTISGWGALAIEFNAFVVGLKEMGLDVQVIAHAKEGDEDKKISPQMKGGSKDILYQSADLIGYLHYEGKKRVLTYAPSQVHIAKSVAGLGSITIPDIEDSPVNTLADILDRVRSKMSEMSNAGKKANDEISQFAERLEGVKSFEEFAESLKGLTTAYSRSVAFQNAKDRLIVILDSIVEKPTPAKFDTVSGMIKSLPEFTHTVTRSWLRSKMEETGFKFDKESGKFVKPEDGQESTQTAQDAPGEENEPGTVESGHGEKKTRQKSAKAVEA